ncbi:Arylsulfatase [Planctomycetes bacterium Pan216]|uniref:Arylsulfatase n=1 Tax=Kolteria novifilia TaxID=2527975 RepID=A0A518B803_9BACT|nr:Arylsulfatase [Planctomycetes bacterium Pan216]
MERKRLWGIGQIAVLAAYLALGMPTTFAQAAEEKSPNIVLILTDDQGWSQLSTTMDPRRPEAASKYLETPNMAKLINNGMRFTSGYSPAPLCTPTRRCILCGTSAARSGSEFVSKWVPADHLTIPNALKAANPNYRCAHFGKWGERMISTPEQCGYDVSDGETGNVTGGMPNSLGVKGGHNDGPPHFIDNEDAKRTNSVTDRAIAFMKKEVAEKHPFYVQVSYYAVHLSVVASEKNIKKYEDKGTPDRGYTAAWAAMMEEMDDGVGRILTAIDKLGIEDNTYVFFTADNGGRGTVPGGDKGRQATNFPLTGSKHSLNEGGIRVPFLVVGPGIAPGSVCDTPVVGYDFLPTFRELAGGKGKVSDEVDGVSIAPLLDNPKTKLDRPQGALFFHRPGRLSSAVRQGDDKLMVTWNRNGKVTSRELYRVGADPREEGHEVTADNAKRATELEGILKEYLTEVNAETPQDMPQKKRRKRAQKKPVPQT